jgi:hypothetical protein
MQYYYLLTRIQCKRGLLFGVASWWVGVGANSQLVDRYGVRSGLDEIVMHMDEDDDEAVPSACPAFVLS